MKTKHGSMRTERLPPTSGGGAGRLELVFNPCSEIQLHLHWAHIFQHYRAELAQ